MAIQWFPGHMQLSKQALVERVRDIDVVIELLDARLPGSSANPLLHALTGHKPRLVLLNKQDLADPVCIALWLDVCQARDGSRALALDAFAPAPLPQIMDACRRLAPQRGSMARPLRVLVCGVPNVGKSTLVNCLARKRQAKTGDEAGVTRTEQRLSLADGFYLWDTPGMLWPRIAVPESGYHLAASGAMGRRAYDEELVALHLLRRLQQRYAPRIAARYPLGLAADAIAAMPDAELLEAIGRQRGAVQSGGRVNRPKTAEMLLADFRSASLGRITLETPQEFETWRAAALAEDARREARKNTRIKVKGLLREAVADPEQGG